VDFFRVGAVERRAENVIANLAQPGHLSPGLLDLAQELPSQAAAVRIRRELRNFLFYAPDFFADLEKPNSAFSESVSENPPSEAT